MVSGSNWRKTTLHLIDTWFILETTVLCITGERSGTNWHLCITQGAATHKWMRRENPLPYTLLTQSLCRALSLPQSVIHKLLPQMLYEAIFWRRSRVKILKAVSLPNPSLFVCFLLVPGFSVASMRLAYKELEIDRKMEDKKIQNMEGKKREQAERLGMGFGNRRWGEWWAGPSWDVIDQRVMDLDSSRSRDPLGDIPPRSSERSRYIQQIVYKCTLWTSIPSTWVSECLSSFQRRHG